MRLFLAETAAPALTSALARVRARREHQPQQVQQAEQQLQQAQQAEQQSQEPQQAEQEPQQVQQAAYHLAELVEEWRC
jgi:hypothetical protein